MAPHVTGVAAGACSLLLIADGTGWIRAWFTALAVPEKAMVPCWYHLREHYCQKISGSGLPKAAKKSLLGWCSTPC